MPNSGSNDPKQGVTPMSDLKNKVALVTGGSTGIGRAVAAELAARGATVVVTGRNAATLEESASQHPGIRAIVADVTLPEEISRTIEDVRAREGRLDILVNNAGVAPLMQLEGATPAHVDA